MLPSASRAAIDRYLLPAGPTAANLQQRSNDGTKQGCSGAGTRSDGVPPLFRQGGRVSHFPHFFGLKFVQKLVHGCNWLLTETHNFSTAELIFYVTVNLFLSLVSGVPHFLGLHLRDKETDKQPTVTHTMLLILRGQCQLKIVNGSSSDAATGGRGEASPYGWTSKNYVICVCFHCRGNSSYHTTNALQGRRSKSHVDTQTIQPGLGDFVL